jgi:hypothetical protein
MSRLLIVHHSPTPATRQLTEAVVEGAGDDAITGVDVVVRAALDTTLDDVTGADGFPSVPPPTSGSWTSSSTHGLRA